MRELDMQEDVLTIDKVLFSAGRLGLYGMKIHVSPFINPVPKIQISSEFEWCTDQGRAKANQKLLDLFGTKEVCYMSNGRDIFVSPEQAVALNVSA